MLIARVLRPLPAIGAVIILASCVLNWVVVTTPGGLSTGTAPPLSVPILGVALLILSFFPVVGRWRGVLSGVLLVASMAAVLITLWALAQTIFQATQLPMTRLGAGPLVALIGAVVFIVGAVIKTQGVPGEEEQVPRYKVIGLEDDSDVTATDSAVDKTHRLG